MKKLLLLLALTLLAAGLAGCGNSSGNVAVPEKPVLYLYPEEEMEVTVTLDFDGTLTSTYPAYGDGWTVTARPDGTLTNPATGREYYCLFWEGSPEAEYDFSAGFCVAGEDTAAFLEGALDRLEPDRGGRLTNSSSTGCQSWRQPYNLLSFQTGGLHRLRRADHRPGPRYPDPGVPGVEGAGRAGGGGAPDVNRPGAHRLHRRGVGRRGSGLKTALKSRRT